MRGQRRVKYYRVTPSLTPCSWSDGSWDEVTRFTTLWVSNPCANPAGKFRWMVSIVEVATRTRKKHDASQ